MEKELIKGLDFGKIFKKDKIRSICLVAGICGIILIYLSTVFDLGDRSGADSTEDSAGGITLSVLEYEQAIENNLKKVVSAITGEDNPIVMVTLENAGGFVYATDTRRSVSSTQETDAQAAERSESSEEYESTYLIVRDSKGNEHALTLSEIQPKIKGVVVVSEYGDVSTIQEQLVQSVRTVLNLPSSKIYVASQKKK